MAERKMAEKPYLLPLWITSYHCKDTPLLVNVQIVFLSKQNPPHQSLVVKRFRNTKGRREHLEVSLHRYATLEKLIYLSNLNVLEAPSHATSSDSDRAMVFGYYL